MRDTLAHTHPPFANHACNNNLYLIEEFALHEQGVDVSFLRRAEGLGDGLGLEVVVDPLPFLLRSHVLRLHAQGGAVGRLQVRAQLLDRGAGGARGERQHAIQGERLTGGKTVARGVQHGAITGNTDERQTWAAGNRIERQCECCDDSKSWGARASLTLSQQHQWCSRRVSGY
jgi:hypothetical protein